MEPMQVINRRRRIAILALVMLVAAIAGLATISRRAPEPAIDDAPVVAKIIAQVEIRISEDGIEQPTVQVKPGTAVILVNDDNKSHTLVADNVANNKVIGFQTDDIPPSQRFSYTFTTPGTFTYHDKADPAVAGTVKVVSTAIAATDSNKR